VHTDLVCDDNNACTNDTCIPSQGCNYTPIAVPQGNKCLGIYCDKIAGIVKTPTICPSACSGCDEQLGCTNCPGSSEVLSTAAAVGIGAGATAGIVIAVIVAAALVSYSSKKAYPFLSFYYLLLT
jgi:hypothetical protein